jgi:hypothetical protein
VVKVHVWLPEGNNVGHTALTIGDVYVSFWPEGHAGKKDFKIKRSQAGTFVSALQEDIRNEGGRVPETMELRGLDESKILDYVAKLIENRPLYQITNHNCSHVIANCLMAGTDKHPSFTPNAGAYATIGKLFFGTWTPDQVLKYARELQRHEGSL